MKRRKNNHNKRLKKKVKKEKEERDAEIKEGILDEKKKLEAERHEEIQKLFKFLKTEEDEGENEAEDEGLDMIDDDDEDDDESNPSPKSEKKFLMPHGDSPVKSEYKPLNCDVLSKESKDEVKAQIEAIFKTVPPRHHQLDAVTCLIHDISQKITSNSPLVEFIHPKRKSQKPTIKTEPETEEGRTETETGTEKAKEHLNYLVQHAAGSGKSLTISCLACALVRLECTTKEEGSHGAEKVPVFDKVIVVSDRKHLDSQLGECVCSLLEANNIRSYVRVKTVVELEKALLSDTKVIITTLQKFSSTTGTAAATTDPDGNAAALLEQFPVAIISDEAHRSHGSKTTRKLHALLTGDTQQAPNIVYFAFTSTPSPRSLEMFGNRQNASDNGSSRMTGIRPFHTFTFPEALSAGYILDFTANYAFVTSDILIEEVGDQSTAVVSDGHRAAAALIAQAEEYAPFLAAKAQFVVTHLVSALAELDRPEAGFRALAMLVVRSRRHIVWYTRYLRGLVAALPEEQRFGIIAAFSPFVFEGANLTEASPDINEGYARLYNTKFGIVQAIREKEGADIRLIVVADKLQTGFDEPRLSVLYVDKPLRGSNVVQTLGRVSRAAPGKSEVFVVDFANKKDDISAAVSMYWDVSVLEGPPSKLLLQKKLASLAGELGALDGVYEDDPRRALVALVAEDIRRKRLGDRDKFSSAMTLFLRLCDRLQVDEEAGVKYSTIQCLKSAFFEVKTLDRSSEIKSLTDSVRVKFEFNKGSSVTPEPLKLSNDMNVFKYGISVNPRPYIFFFIAVMYIFIERKKEQGEANDGGRGH